MIMCSVRHVVAIFLIISLDTPVGGQTRPIVAAASDLTFALEEVSERFEENHGLHVDLVFGASGNLARQILDGAPFDLFLSADEALVDKLAAAGLTRDQGTLYATGRLALYAPRGSPLAVDERLDGLRALIERGGVTRFAIANPDHAPYGRAAQALLRAKGLWEPLQPALVLGASVSQAARFATTGNAVGGIVAHSLVIAPSLRDSGAFALLPEADHPPLKQRMVLLQRASSAAARFYGYLQEPEARAILERYGFRLPGP